MRLLALRHDATTADRCCGRLPDLAWMKDEFAIVIKSQRGQTISLNLMGRAVPPFSVPSGRCDCAG
jgi:hypothetical protein